MPNLFSSIPDAGPNELIETLVHAEHVRIERIVSHGHASPSDFWYDQDQHEWVLLVQGAARLRMEDATIVLEPGDFFHIPPHKKHRVDSTKLDGPTIWLAVFYD